MGNCVSISIPCDSCMNEVSRWHDEKGGYIHNLEKNLTFLETTMEELRARRDDLSRRVTREEDRVENRCKVAFTTRSQDVCAHMGVEEPMEVQCLSDNDAFDLFQKKVGQVTLGSDPDLARTVARKCRGRYDNLKEERLKLCFLYCALFPEDYKIQKSELIDYWICEGLIDGNEDIERAENKGYEIIGSLVRASLLMGDVTNKVCMHDIIREMALWIASDLGQGKEAFIVHAGVRSLKMPKVKNWNIVRRVSLMHNKILYLRGSHECLQLTTLLLQKAKLGEISSEFFKYMPKLELIYITCLWLQNLWDTPCFSSLSVVKIQDCNCLRELTLLMFASNLKELDVLGAKELKDIINKEKASRGEESGIAPFPKLIILRLSSLPELKNIHWKPLPLPCLKEICVMRCPNLKKLPLDSKSGRHGENGLFISYSRKEWIEGLVEWKDEATKTRFLSSCKKV
ncbi:hypothetical protein HID58_085716 [Brassica napus]|uniref:Disease resistance protein n=1 Tax=Brassica napus TaxID=3708 RepID=A0ABQ7XND2_BRANA|nr:hypothetical protein HID58_085716 [Brassica napus]